MTERWVECPQCEGSGGSESLDDSDPVWIECPDCEGSEGWMEETTGE